MSAEKSAAAPPTLPATGPALARRPHRQALRPVTLIVVSAIVAFADGDAGEAKTLGELVGPVPRQGTVVIVPPIVPKYKLGARNDDLEIAAVA